MATLVHICLKAPEAGTPIKNAVVDECVIPQSVAVVVVRFMKRNMSQENVFSEKCCLIDSLNRVFAIVFVSTM